MTALVLASYVADWLDILFRWFHVIVAVTWLGTSIYFVRTDTSMAAHAPEHDEDSMKVGEHWGVHAGGFYHVTKYKVPPAPPSPPPEIATPWPAWSTWITGFILMSVVYYANARTYLIDPSVADISPAAAISISIGMLIVGWLLYDIACRVLGRWEWLVALAVIAIAVVGAVVAINLFSPRAAFLQVGAMLGTLMSANVLVVIAPMNNRMGRAPGGFAKLDPADGARAKQRSVHNTYLTLPVLFAMLSNHASFIYGSSHAWLVLLVLMVVGALIRHAFILYRRNSSVPVLVPAISALAVAVLVVAMLPKGGSGSAPAPPAAGGSSGGSNVVDGKAVFQSAGCASCHTLQDAGATGKAGPDLDALRPNADLVRDVVTNGRGAMPPFKSRLKADEIGAVSDYVARVAGGG